MRLMGTNVTIGRSTKEHRALSDIKTWVDKKSYDCHESIKMVFTRQRQYAVKKMFVSICF
ncbi:unnamed protein product [Spirodela intermedia]|uniref:Uncharacterized protein n=1 Tax=Spirodela intermedia TaxID=51605 RepID=A0A7I8J7I9_SPIIN|nr:unnamed protein product [Spirodela intermedia]CAA6665695.1 unnamed protein product [Spirodela intermedia]